jgi:hypothetical protein
VVCGEVWGEGDWEQEGDHPGVALKRTLGKKKEDVWEEGQLNAVMAETELELIW